MPECFESRDLCGDFLAGRAPGTPIPLVWACHPGNAMPNRGGGSMRIFLPPSLSTPFSVPDWPGRGVIVTLRDANFPPTDSGRLVNRALLLMVPMWPALGACLLWLMALLGGRSRGRFTAIASVLLSLGCLIAGSVISGTAPPSGWLWLGDYHLLPGRLTPDLLRIELASDPVSRLWCGSLVLAVLALMISQSRTSLPLSSHSSGEAFQRAAQLASLAALQMAAVAQDFSVDVFCGGIVLACAAFLLVDVPSAAVRRMGTIGGFALILFLIAMAWAWHAFQTVNRNDLLSHAIQSVGDDAAMAQLHLTGSLVIVGSLVLMASFPCFGWVRDVAGSRQSAFVFGVGPLLLGGWLLFQAMPLAAAAGIDRELLTGLPTITALTAGFVALTVRTLREAIGLAVVVWGAILSGGLTDPVSANPAAFLLLSQPLLVCYLLIVADAREASPHSGWETAGWGGVIAAAAGLAGLGPLVEPGLQGLRNGQFDMTAVQSMGAVIGHALVCFGLAKGMCRHSLEQVDVPRTMAGSGWKSALACGLLIAGLMVVEVCSWLPKFFSFASGMSAGSRGVIAAVGLCGVIVGWRLYARASVFPDWLSRRCESLDRLSRRGLYLEDAATAVERASVRLAEAWRAADLPMQNPLRGSRPMENPAVRDGEVPALPAAGWRVLAVLATAAVLWFVTQMAF